MKKTIKQITILLCCAAFSLSSCTSEDIVLPLQEPTVNPCLRTVDGAIGIAQQYIDVNAKGRAGLMIKLSAKSVHPIYGRDSRSGSDPLMYAVDFDDDNGFIIVSANTNTEPILAVIDKGNFTETSAKKVDGFEIFMATAADYVRSIPFNPPTLDTLREDFRMVYKVDTISMVRMYEPRLKTEWGPYWPENMFAPNKNAGCTPVAVAQLCAHLDVPYNSLITFEGRPFDYLNVDWNKLKKHVHSTKILNPTEAQIDSLYSLCSADYQTHVELAALIREFGVLTSAYYLDSGYTPSVWNAKDFIPKFMSDREYRIIDKSQLYNELMNGGVAMINSVEHNEFCHDWIADAAGDIKYNIITYYNYCPATGQYDYKEVKTQTHKYVHHNWGYAGEANGYFLEGVYDTDLRFDYTGPTMARTNYESGNMTIFFFPTKSQLLYK